jgi:NodT family efflux transporter outer membrane factor (OMF) lipoprotein
MHWNARWAYPLALAAAASGSSCAVGPNFHPPPAPTATGYTVAPLPSTTASADVLGGDAQSFVSTSDVAFRWWEAFQCPALNAVVSQTLSANPTVPAAQAALRQAQQLVAAQRGYFFPNLAADYQFERQKLPGNIASTSAPGIQGNGQNLSPSAPAQPLTYNFQTAELTVGFTPDVFGANRRRVESLQAQADLQRYELEATYVTLAANVVAAAIQEATTRAQMTAAQQIIAASEQSLAVLRDKFERGYSSGVDVAAGEAELAQSRALLPPLSKQLEQTRDLLRALTGRLPDDDVPQTFTLGCLRLPANLPVSVPSQLIGQRPDVQAALAQLHAANAQIGVAVAAMLPQFSISGAIGGSANEFPWMFRSGGPFWNLIGGVAQPIFDGGTLWHTKRAADEATRQAAAQYQEAVLGAYQNVADTLHAIVSDANALSAARAAELAAKTTLDLTQRQMQQGFNDYLAELAAEIEYQQALLNLVQAQSTRFGDSAALYVALGGGWWNRSTAEAEQ